MGLFHVVRLKSMSFHARVGVLPHEAEIDQPVEVDVSVWVSRDAYTGQAGTVMDYRVLYDLVNGIMHEGHILYLEDVIERIAHRSLLLPAVTRVAVSARKINVALPGPLSYAEVSLDRSRE